MRRSHAFSPPAGGLLGRPRPGPERPRGGPRREPRGRRSAAVRRLGRPSRRDQHVVRRRPAFLRPRPHVGVGIRPLRGRALVPGRRAARSRLRDAPLGPGPRVGTARQCRHEPRGRARSVRSQPPGARTRRPGDRTRACLRRGARGALQPAGAPGPLGSRPGVRRALVAEYPDDLDAANLFAARRSSPEAPRWRS